MSVYYAILDDKNVKSDKLKDMSEQTMQPTVKC